MTSVCPPRLVLAVANEHVLYSNGGTSHRECLVKTFRRWKTRTQAEARP